ncbi:MAG TPA: hypothetical protein VMW52_10575 [Phycisphaerae bacterium]|nr:hypothetical protein [Phycisphaerae bacterium]
MAKLSMDAFPWDLTFHIGGKDYPTLPTTTEMILADLGRADVPTDKPRTAEAIKAALETVKAIFPEEHCPPLETMEWTDVVTIREAYAAYVEDRLKKKREGFRQALGIKADPPANPVAKPPASDARKS